MFPNHSQSNAVPTAKTENSKLIENVSVTSSSKWTAQPTRGECSSNSKILLSGCMAGTALGVFICCFFKIPLGIEVAETIAGCAGFGTCISGGCAVCCKPEDSEKNNVSLDR